MREIQNSVNKNEQYQISNLFFAIDALKKLVLQLDPCRKVWIRAKNCLDFAMIAIDETEFCKANALSNIK